MANEEIEGVNDKYIATTITEDDILKISRQLDHSIGGYMVYFQYACIILSAILIYLLTKIIIEKNENAISMVKILGYENKEISSLCNEYCIPKLFDEDGRMVPFLCFSTRLC